MRNQSISTRCHFFGSICCLTDPTCQRIGLSNADRTVIDKREDDVRVRFSGRSSLDVERVVDCPFSFALDEADELFVTLEASGATVPFRQFGLPVAGALRHGVDVHFTRRRDALEPGRSHDEIAFAWTTRSFWLPNFAGVLRFRIDMHRTRALLHGEYVPPFGIFGRSFDRIVGRRLARATLTELLDRLAQMLESQYRAFKTRYDSA